MRILLHEMRLAFFGRPRKLNPSRGNVMTLTIFREDAMTAFAHCQSSRPIDLHKAFGAEIVGTLLFGRNIGKFVIALVNKFHSNSLLIKIIGDQYTGSHIENV